MTGPTVFRPYPRRLESLTAFANVITKAALSSQLFKDPKRWPGRGLNPRPRARQTGALPAKVVTSFCEILVQFKRLYIIWPNTS